MKEQKRIITVIATLVVMFTALMIVLTPMTVGAASDHMVITASSVTATPGDEVQVTIALEGNPGLASLKFDVAYDDALTLTNIEFSTAFGAYVTAPTPYKNPQTVSFISPLVDVADNGTFITLTFLISESAPDNYEAAVSVICDEENIFDGNYDQVPVSAVNGAVNVIHGIPGDIDGDRKVNNKDAIMLFRHVAGWDVEVDHKALDVNCDGSVNNKDAITLFRYVAGWEGIEIGRGPTSTVCKHEKTEVIPGYEPTCEASGLTNGSRCALCGETLEEQEEIAPLGHKMGAWIPVLEPTCTEAGWEMTVCERCNYEERREVLPVGHQYQNGVCIECGTPKETIPTGPAFIVSNATAKAGDTVEVTVALKNNPGIASIILNTTFDDAALDLQSVTYNTSIGGQTVPPQNLASPLNLYWVNGFANATGDFVLATLTFKVSDTAAAGSYAVTVSYLPDNVYDISETNIDFEIVDGSIKVS